MTKEQKELDRKFSCAIDTLDTYIDFERNHVPHDAEGLTVPMMLESVRNTFIAIHKDWRAHIGDPIMDKQKIIGGLIHELADMVERGRIEF